MLFGEVTLSLTLVKLLKTNPGVVKIMNGETMVKRYNFIGVPNQCPTRD